MSKMTQDEKIEYALKMREAVLAMQLAGMAEELLAAHRAAFKAGFGKEAVLIVQGNQMMLEAKAAGKGGFFADEVEDQ
jgi:hypothetical protein